MSVHSQNIDDSPVSDNKMDISEPTTATTSQESPEISPEIEPKVSLAASDSIGALTSDTKSKSLASIADSTTKSDSSCNNTRASNGYFSGSDQPDDKYDDNSLDNRHLISKNTVTNSTQRTALTLVDMHPLMASPFNDDEDDLSPESLTLEGACNFHDFQPEIESTVLETPMEYNRNDSPKSKSEFLCKSYVSSDESEPDISQYKALVEPTLQTVSLTNYSTNKMQLSVKTSGLRKISLTQELMATHDDDSSVETFSNHSFDDDDIEFGTNEANFMKSNNLQSTGGKQADFIGECNKELNYDRISNQPEESLVITLSDGQTRDIDMKVIEPYKRVLSHGGYLKAGGHNAIVIFSACYLPDRSRTDYHYVMENLFFYVIKTLEQFVTEDYILIYLHGGSTRNTVPPFPWLKKCYQLLDRRIRKSLKNLYMVHPTFWLKSIVWMARPFISSKFWRKLVYIRTLDELYQIIPVEKAAVPEKVKKYDLKHL